LAAALRLAANEGQQPAGADKQKPPAALPSAEGLRLAFPWPDMTGRERNDTAAVVVAAVGVAAMVASVVLRLSPFKPPQQEERTSPADDCGRKNVKPSTLCVCHRHRARRGAAPEGLAGASGPRPDRSRCSRASAIARVGKGPSIGR